MQLPDYSILETIEKSNKNEVITKINVNISQDSLINPMVIEVLKKYTDKLKFLFLKCCPDHNPKNG